nr:MLO-like protein 15 isoform X3 [Aegilops tauschii subsp. strangulata]
MEKTRLKWDVKVGSFYSRVELGWANQSVQSHTPKKQSIRSHGRTTITRAPDTGADGTGAKQWHGRVGSRCAASELANVTSNRRWPHWTSFFFSQFLIGTARSTRSGVPTNQARTADRERATPPPPPPCGGPRRLFCVSRPDRWPEGEADRLPVAAEVTGVMEGGGAGGEVDADALEYTPTWIVAGVCSLIVTISLAAERCLHYLGKTLKRKHQKALFEALLKVKEELMLLGFISLLMTVSQDVIQRTCIPPSWTNYLLPCKKMEEHSVAALGGRRLLPRNAPRSDHCRNKGKVPLLSLEALHQLHIFIFVLAITHVIFSVLTMVLGGAKIRQWKQWETEIHKNNAGNGPKKLTNVQQFEFIRERFNGVGMESTVLSWMHSFVKQFYASVTKSDYATMRLGFIMTHCRGNPKFGFHRYMVRALEADFKKVVGIRWYLWIFVVIFMLLNVNGWHTYFWISFLPLILLLAVGTKLEHVIAQLAHDVAEKHSAIEGDLVVNPSDEHFWCGKPRVILYLIHFILFQNAFEIALFFWILVSVLCKVHISRREKKRGWMLVTNCVSVGFSFCHLQDHLRLQLVHHGPRPVHRAEARHRGRHPAAVQLQHPAAVRDRGADGDLLQQGDLRRAHPAGAGGVGAEGQDEDRVIQGCCCRSRGRTHQARRVLPAGDAAASRRHDAVPPLTAKVD